MKKLLALFILCLLLLCDTQKMQAQGLMGHKHEFTKADTLRGTLSPVRTWFDVTYYDLNMKLDPEKSKFRATMIFILRFWKKTKSCKLICLKTLR